MGSLSDNFLHENPQLTISAHRKFLKPSTLTEICEEDSQEGDCDAQKKRSDAETPVRKMGSVCSANPPGSVPNADTDTDTATDDEKSAANRDYADQSGEDRKGSLTLPLNHKLSRTYNPLFEKNQTKRPSVHYSSHDAIENYYDHNQYTVTGRDRNVDVFNKLPIHLQRRVSNSQDNVSRVSSPGALGETVAPTTRRFDKSLYWLAFHRKKIGLRHLCFLLLLLCYTLFGAFIFYRIESHNERLTVKERSINLENLITELALEIEAEINHPNISTSVQSLRRYIRKSYVSLLKLESQYKGSTYYKLEDDDNYKWTFSSAFFFCMNVYTTTGYGAIAAETILGQFITICYAMVFVPVTLVIIRDLGQFFLVHFTKLYAHITMLTRQAQGKKEANDDEIIRLPIRICLLILFAYLLVCTTFVYVYDDNTGPDGLSLFHSFYFSFVSLTTIGFGDVMPTNVTFAPIISIVFFVGMAVTKVVNRTTYIAVENGLFGAMTVVENRMDRLVNADVHPVEDDTKRPQKSASFDVPSLKEEDVEKNAMLNNFTIKSIATFMRSNQDVYGGGFGRVQLRRGDLLPPEGTTSPALRARAASVSIPPTYPP